MADATDGKVLAQEILTALGEDFTLPAVDLSGADFQLPDSLNNPLYEDLESPSIEDLTEGVVGGAGAFDKIMSSHKAHLEEQREQGLITGSEYTKAYIELTTTAMSAGLQMVLQGDAAKWQAAAMQMQARIAEINAVKARVELETAKAQLAAQRYQSQLLESQDVLTKMQIATEDAKYDLTHEQKHLIEEQVEAARAQTMDTRRDGSTIVGAIGKQKDLHTQQVTSYQRDSEYKLAKVYADAFITQKTLDDLTVAPDNFKSAEIDEVFNILRGNLNLGTAA